MEETLFAFKTPYGPLIGRVSERGLQRLELRPRIATPAAGLPRDHPVAGALAAALNAYFAGRPEDFAGIPLDLDGATAFRRHVWEAARNVPWGKTVSYGELCAMMGKSRGAARAVGQALGANPIPILIPCHRILACGGGLGGFSCGLDWKVNLLRIEGHEL